MSDQLTADFVAKRAELLRGHRADGSQLAALPAQLAALTEEWLVALFNREASGLPSGVALVSVGALGRNELCPGSDIDLLLCHADGLDTADLADRLWYPVWDSKLRLGHAVRSLSGALELAAANVDVCTGSLDARHIAGDAQVTAALQAGIGGLWQRDASSQLAKLKTAIERDQRRHGEVAYLLEPELKLGVGGLRDIHAVRWASAGGQQVAPADRSRLDDANGVLLGARTALHLVSGHSGDLLVADDQDPVAELLGYDDADALMAAVARAARDVGFIAADLWRQVAPTNGEVVPTSSTELDSTVASLTGDGVTVTDSEVAVTEAAVASAPTPADAAVLLLRAAVVSARLNRPLSRPTLNLFAASRPALPDPWPREARDLFVQLLSSGDGVVDVIEALDFAELWTGFLPEWAPCRNRPQRSRYHRFTVDRHLMEAAAQAAAVVDRVNRPDLLVVAALLHDIGKGYPGDHTVVGTGLAPSIMRRLGFDEADATTVARLITHHLLLTDVATRRDLHDPLTVERVAHAVETPEFLTLLAALVEADCLATGPMAWSKWTAELVDTLVGFVADYLAGSPVPPASQSQLVDGEVTDLVASGLTHVVGSGEMLTIVAPDAPGVFSRAAGALALRGLEVLQAEAYSSPIPASGDGSSGATAAVSAFRIVPPESPVDWERTAHDVRMALAGQLALRARIAQRRDTYRRRQALAATTASTTVRFDTGATNATIVEVRTEDAVGVLYKVTRTLADMGLDIRSAKIQTLANEVVDTFYVVGPNGPTLSAQHQREIEMELQHAL